MNSTNDLHHREKHSLTEPSNLQKRADSNTSTDMTERSNLKKQEEIFKLLLETITDVSSLKVENKRAITKLEASQEKYDKSACHHTKFPNLRAIQQNEVDKARQSVEKINEELDRRDAIFKDLAGQSIPVLLPVIQAGGYQVNQNFEDPKALEQLEKLLGKTERQFTELQQEFNRFKEEQKSYQSAKEKQIADQETKLKAIMSIDLEREKETAKLRSQLRILNDEFSTLQKERVACQAEIGTINDIANNTAREIRAVNELVNNATKEVGFVKDLASNTAKEIGAINDIANNAVQEIGVIKDLAKNAAKENSRIESYLKGVEERSHEKFKPLETQIGSISSIKSTLKNLRENGLFDVKITTLDDMSTTLKVAMSRIDSLPSAASYFSLNSRLEILEKEIVPDLLRNEVADLVVTKVEDRLKDLEYKIKEEPHLLQSSPSISAVEEKVSALTNLIAARPDLTKYDEDIFNLRCTNAELQRSLKVVRENIASLTDRAQSNMISGLDDARLERMIDTKARIMANDTMRKISEVSQTLATTNHSLENLMARVDNITTGHLAQAMLNQLSETYPHLQNVEQSFISQKKSIQELQAKIDQMSKAKIETPISKNQGLIPPQSNSPNNNSNHGRNLGKEVDKLSEDIFKVSLTIKRLISMMEDDRRFTREKFDSQPELVSKEDLHKHKLELDSHIKTLIEQYADEYNRNPLVPQLDKAPKLLTIEAPLKDKHEIEIGSTLAEKNACAINKIEKGVISLREGLMTRIMKEIQQQKSTLEDFIISQVDRCLASKRSDLVKEVARRVELKIAINNNKESSEYNLGTPNLPSMAIPNTPITSSPNLQNTESQRNKRKLHEIKSESPRTTNINSNGSFITNKKSRFTSSVVDDTI